MGETTIPALHLQVVTHVLLKVAVGGALVQVQISAKREAVLVQILNLVPIGIGVVLNVLFVSLALQIRLQTKNALKKRSTVVAIKDSF
mmetsp:Transcript_9034/g.10318  ORF Transcript_9034/g.10318 Transcript_9034/m.10318 type:complete len:88 (-) Transcript_9034:227-490(-)